MQLEIFLAANQLTYAEFARRIGSRHARTVQRYAKRLQRPNLRMMAEIARETNGAVTANDFFGISPLPAPSSAPSVKAEAA